MVGGRPPYADVHPVHPSKQNDATEKLIAAIEQAHG